MRSAGAFFDHSLIDAHDGELIRSQSIVWHKRAPPRRGAAQLRVAPRFRGVCEAATSLGSTSIPLVRREQARRAGGDGGDHRQSQASLSSVTLPNVSVVEGLKNTSPLATQRARSPSICCPTNSAVGNAVEPAPRRPSPMTKPGARPGVRRAHRRYRQRRRDLFDDQHDEERDDHFLVAMRRSGAIPCRGGRGGIAAGHARVRSRCRDSCAERATPRPSIPRSDDGVAAPYSRR